MKSLVNLARLRGGERDRGKGEEDGRDRKKMVSKQGWEAKEKEERKRERTNELQWQVGPDLWFPTFPISPSNDVIPGLLATMAAQVPCNDGNPGPLTTMPAQVP